MKNSLIDTCRFFEKTLENEIDLIITEEIDFLTLNSLFHNFKEEYIIKRFDDDSCLSLVSIGLRNNNNFLFTENNISRIDNKLSLSTNIGYKSKSKRSQEMIGSLKDFYQSEGKELLVDENGILNLFERDKIKSTIEEDELRFLMNFKSFKLLYDSYINQRSYTNEIERFLSFPISKEL